VKNSYKTEGFGFPFGFLKANTQKSGVTLTVVAYNYPALFTLLGKSIAPSAHDTGINKDEGERCHSRIILLQ